MAFFYEHPELVISIHALREEGDTAVGAHVALHIGFLSTPSARRATRKCHVCTACRCISIHALREEGDRYSKSWA